MAKVSVSSGGKSLTMYKSQVPTKPAPPVLRYQFEIPDLVPKIGRLDGVIFDIKIVSMFSNHVYGLEASLSYVAPPPFAFWSTPVEAFPERPCLTPQSGFAATTRERIPTLFWFEGRDCLMGGRPGAVTDTIYDTNCQMSSAIAATSLAPNREEVFYGIFPFGNMGAAKSIDDPNINPTFTQYCTQFNLVKAKRDLGSLVAVSDRAISTSHLWWIAPGYIKKMRVDIVWYTCRKGDAGWRKPEIWTSNMQDVSVEHEYMTSLAAIANEEYLTVYYRSSRHGLVSVTRVEGQPSRCFCKHDFGVDPKKDDEFRMEVSSGLCAIKVGSKNLVFWVTKSGAIMTSRDSPSVMFAGVNGKDEINGSRTVDSEAAPPGNASLRTEIAAVWAPAGDQKELYMWYFAPDGRLMGARGSIGKGDIITWTSFEMAPPGSGTTEGRMRVLVTTWDKPLIRVWWIDAKRRIQWQAPLSVLQLSLQTNKSI